MTSRCLTVAFQGIEAISVDVQVHIAPGLPAFQIVGLGDKAVNESKERIRAAFHSINLSLPPKRVTVNLAPADLQKEGSHYDLPIALGILAALGVIDEEVLSDYLALGEIGLDGGIYNVLGILPSSITAHSQNKGLICSLQSVKEAKWSGLEHIVAGTTLLDIIHMLKHGKKLDIASFSKEISDTRSSSISHRMQGNLKEIKGQHLAKRALEIAAAGGHNILLSGPPGAGKSMLASRFVTLLPQLTSEQALEATMIHSLAGLLPENGLITDPPFRDPHHSATLPALVGGGLKCRPGELSLAHHGVLFLDELPEFNRSALEALRQPLETGYISIARANTMVRYPAKVQLIAAMNPCKCGYFGNPSKQCARVPLCGEQYQQRLSGPLLDRFDLKVHIEDVKIQDLLQKSDTENKNENNFSDTIAHRVQKVRHHQYERSRHYAHMQENKDDDNINFYAGQQSSRSPHILNAHLSGEYLQRVTELSSSCEDLLLKASEKMHLTARGIHRILKVARTIADLDESENLKQHHVAEAIHYRS